jgi:hypothetical protein
VARDDDPRPLSSRTNARKRRTKRAPLITQNHKSIPTAVRAQRYKVAYQLENHTTTSCISPPQRPRRLKIVHDSGRYFHSRAFFTSSTTCRGFTAGACWIR